jgi:hypothetical protein
MARMTLAALIDQRIRPRPSTAANRPAPWRPFLFHTAAYAHDHHPGPAVPSAPMNAQNPSDSLAPRPGAVITDGVDPLAYVANMVFMR